jgi:hypothetical protein
MPATVTELRKILDDLIWQVDGTNCPKTCTCVVHYQQRERIASAFSLLWWYPNPRNRLTIEKFPVGPLGDPLCDPDCSCLSHNRQTPKERMAEGGRRSVRGSKTGTTEAD